MGKRELLEEILEMDEKELLEWVKEQCVERELEFEPDMLDGTGKQALYDFIASDLHTELQAELHSECQIGVGCGMFPNAETDEDLEDEMEHINSRD